MPKEKISDNVIDGWFAEVSWRREEHVCPCGQTWSAECPIGTQCVMCTRNVPATSGHVQIASVNPDSPFKFPTGPNETDEPFDGWRVTLDADQVDYLITVLRKARRQAFPMHSSAHAGSVSVESAEQRIVSLQRKSVELQLETANTVWDLRQAELNLAKSKQKSA